MIKNLKTANIKNKTVLLRVDVNEPIYEGTVADDFRIQKIIPTIQFLRNNHCKVILIGHLGRPDGHWDKHLSLRPVAQRIAELLNYKFLETKDRFPSYPIPHLIFFTGKVTDNLTKTLIDESPEKDVIVLENLRFYPEEQKNSIFFAKQLASLGSIYVNDAFAASHRKEASIEAIAKQLPSYAGMVLSQEIKGLSYALDNPKHPFVIMMGGMKITDKAKTLEHLGKLADKILLGGGIANSLLEQLGYSVGQSKSEVGAAQVAKRLLRNYKDKIVLPLDVVVADKDMSPASIRVSKIDQVGSKETIFDIGPKTILEFSRHIKEAQTLIWNGPLGLFEHKPFHTGTISLARLIGGVSKGSCYGVVGGGETVDAVRTALQADYIDHLSTGGGAMLQFLAGEKLPGLEALK